MKKITLLFITLLAFSFNAISQDTCATAVSVTAGTHVVSAVDGTEIPDPICAENGAGATAGEWYIYTPTVSGSATVNTDLLINSGDTRVHIYSGTCGSLTCVGGNDDVDYVGGNYLSSVTFNIISGTSYYIAFDDRWNAGGFSFEITEAPATCLDPASFIANAVTFNSFDLSWGDDNTGTPAWEIEWGLDGFTQGTGTMVTGLTTANYVFTGLTENTNYDFFIRSYCGVADGYSNWVGPISFRTILDCSVSGSFPYSESFADVTILDCWVLEDADSTSPVWSYNSGINDINGDGITESFMVVFPQDVGEVAKDDWLFSNKFNMTTTNQYTIDVLYNAFDLNSISNESFDLVIVDAQTSTAAYSSVLNSYSGITQSGAFGANDGTDLISQAYTASETFTPPSDGEYYVAIHATSTASNNLFMVFNLSLTEAALGIEEFTNTNFSYYLNQSTNTLNLESSINMSEIKLFNSIGQEVFNEELGNTNHSIGLNSLSSGIYFGRINIQNRIETIKILIK